MTSRARVTGFAFLEGTLPGGEWLRLPEPRRDEVDPRREDARFPRLDRAAKLLALGARRALGDRPVAGDRSALVLGTLAGCLEADERFDASRRSPEGASPMLFPPTLATSPAAEVSIRLGLKGPVLVVSAGEASLLAAVREGVRLVARGDASLVLACGLETAAPRAPRPGPGPFVESVAVLVLEPAGCGPAPFVEVLPGSPGEAPPARSPDPLGNRAAPELAAALTSGGTVALRDACGFAVSLRCDVVLDVPPGVA